MAGKGEKYTTDGYKIIEDPEDKDEDAQNLGGCACARRRCFRGAMVCCLCLGLAAAFFYNMVYTPGLDNSVGCKVDTGGTCKIAKCRAWRGDTACSSGKCLCKAGYCANNGMCVKRGVCLKDTNSTCRHLNCGWHRGNAQCVEGRCLCNKGFCSDNGVCRLYAMGAEKPNRTVIAEAVEIDEEHPTFPGRHARIESALCVSGGGMRALTLTAGALRVLQASNLMDRIDAISAVSGGAWASALYMFARHTTEELVGVATDPTQLTLDALENQRYIMQEVATRTMNHFVATSVKHAPFDANDLWNEYVASTVLWPAGLKGSADENKGDGLDAQHSFIAASEEHKQRIISKNPRLSAYNFLTPNPKRKQLLVISATLLAPVDSKTGSGEAVSLQMSPDFTGSPFHANNRQVSYARMADSKEKAIWVGGGMEETFAFDNQAPHNLSEVGTELKSVSLPEPMSPFSLMRVLGATSDALAGTMANHWKMQNTDPNALVWPYGQEKGAATEFKLGDGGNLENAGLLSMLQRKVKRIIWLINTDVGIARKSDFDWCHKYANSADVTEVRKAITNQIYDKFGYGFDNTATGLLSKNQVFLKSDLFTMACAAQRKRDAGKPAVVKHTHTVQKNSFWGIQGGWDVDVLYVFNDKVQDFVDQLPAETQWNLGNETDFAHYPFYKTVMQRTGQLTAYTNKQVNLLAAQSEYIMQSQKAFITSFLSGS